MWVQRYMGFIPCRVLAFLSSYLLYLDSVHVWLNLKFQFFFDNSQLFFVSLCHGFIYLLGVEFCLEFWHVSSFIIAKIFELTKSREITLSDIKNFKGFMPWGAFVLLFKNFTCKTQLGSKLVTLSNAYEILGQLLSFKHTCSQF